MKPEIFATVMDFFNSGLPVVHEGAEISGDTEIYDDDDDTVQMIKSTELSLMNKRNSLNKRNALLKEKLSCSFKINCLGFVRQLSVNPFNHLVVRLGFPTAITAHDYEVRFRCYIVFVRVWICCYRMLLCCQFCFLFILQVTEGTC